MSVRRVIVLIIFFFLLFLGVYTWNARTGKWDALGANVGLEVTGGILRIVMLVNDGISSTWTNYWDLVDVRKENDELMQERDALLIEIAKVREEESELERLRSLLGFSYPPQWKMEGGRVLAWRLGSNDFLDSVVISKGFLNGAKTGTPIIVPQGLVGRVLKAGSYTSIALLISDPGSSVSVVTSKLRVHGIIQGEGPGNLLSMRFVKQNEFISVGEILVTSGMDLSYPKGIPVARVVSVEFGADAMLYIKAEPLVAFRKIEEVLLLQNPFERLLPQGSPIYSPRPREFFSPSKNIVDSAVNKNSKEAYDVFFDDQQKKNQELPANQGLVEGGNLAPPSEQIQTRNN